MAKRTSITEQLRQAVLRAGRGGKSRYRIAQETGLSESALSKLARGVVSPTLDTGERIARAIGYRLRLTRLADTVR
jgi:transcriptional regulator with XRE-family HTH domain